MAYTSAILTGVNCKKRQKNRRMAHRLDLPCPLSKEFLLHDLLTGSKFTGEL